MNEDAENLLRQIDGKIGDLISLYKLLNAEKIEEAKRKVLGEATRKAVYEACDGQTSGSTIAKMLNITQPAVSQHIAALVESGLVALEVSEGRRYYTKRLER